MPFRFNPFTDRLDLVESSSSPTGDVQFIAGNSGGNVPPNGSGVINLLGSGLITVTGNVGTNTLTISLATGTLGQTITGNSGGPIPPTAGNWNLIGTATNGINVVGAGSTLTAAMQSPYADGDFTFQSTVSGATRTLTVQNTSNTASSQARLLLAVAGATAGDPWLQLGIGAINSYSLGIQNSATDNLRLTYAASGTVSPSSGTEVFRYDLSQTPSFIFGGGTPLFSPTALLAVLASVAGNASSIEIQNTNTAASSSAALAIRVNGATAGNPQVTYDIFGVSASNWSHGILNSSNDEWVLNNGTGDLSGGNMVMVSQLSGETTWPLQPAFLAYLTTTATNVTGNGTTYVVVGYTEIYDANSDFDPTTGIYTAPVTGKHNFNSILDLADLDITFTQCLKGLVTSNRTYQFEQSNPFRAGDGTFWRISNGIDADMDIGDTAFINVSVSGGTQTVDVRSGGASSILTCFSGKLFA